MATEGADDVVSVVRHHITIAIITSTIISACCRCSCCAARCKLSDGPRDLHDLTAP